MSAALGGGGLNSVGRAGGVEENPADVTGTPGTLKTVELRPRCVIHRRLGSGPGVHSGCGEWRQRGRSDAGGCPCLA